MDNQTIKCSAVFLQEERFDGKIFTPAAQQRIAEHLTSPATIVRPDGLDEPCAAAALANADVLFSTWGIPRLDAEFLDRCPRLQRIFYAAGSVKTFVTPELWKRGIRISSSWRANAIPVAEFALGAILLSLKNVWPYHRLLKAEKNWYVNLPMPGAYQSQVGLVSFGAIGKRLAELLRPFQIKVLVYDPNLDAGTASKYGVYAVALEELFEQSDVVSLHVPWLPQTEKMIGRTLLESMKPYATLINTARGAVVDEDALVDVLQKRPDLTAVLDVTHPEPPLPDSPLWTLPNVLLTPHVAGSTMSEWGRLGDFMVEEFLRYLAGEPPQHEVTEEMLEQLA